jgi:hypothetical protein
MSASLSRASSLRQGPLDPLEHRRPMRRHPGRVGQGREQAPHDPQARPHPTTTRHLRADSTLEPRQPEPAGPSQVTTVVTTTTTPTPHHDSHRGDPGSRAKRPLGNLERGRPHALEQVPQRVDAGHVLLEQLLPAGAEVPQPSPGRVVLIDRLGQVAAQLPGQPGDQHGVLVIGLVRREVLGLARPGRGRRLHAHERHPALGRELSRGGRSGARRGTSGRHWTGPLTGPAGRASPGRPSHVSRPGTGGWCCQHPRVVVGHDQHLLAVGQVDPDDRARDRDRLPQPAQPRVAVPITARNTTTVRHERPPSMRWDTKPDKRIRRTFPTPDRRRSNAFLCR